jgi:hypothetical protein
MLKDGAERLPSHDGGIELREQTCEVDIWISDDPIELAVRAPRCPVNAHNRSIGVKLPELRGQ